MRATACRRCIGLMIALVGLTLVPWPVQGQTTPVISGPAGQYAITLTSAGVVPLWSGPVSGPVGTYTIVVPAGMTPTIVQTATSFTISWGPGPGPVPPPPPPPPGPQTDHLFICVVTDKTATLPDSQGQIVADSKLSTSSLVTTLKTLDAEIHPFDVTTPTLAQWIVQARAAGIPSLLVLAVDKPGHGTLVEAMKLQADSASVIAEVRRLRGGS